MIYDGNDFKGLVVVEKIKRPPLAPVEHSTADWTADGDFPLSTRLATKTIQCDMRMIAPVRGTMNQVDSLELRRRKIVGMLFRRKPKKLILHDAPDLYEMAYLDGETDFERFTHTASMTVKWKCAPASYGATRKRSMPYGGSTRVRVDGTYPTAPILTVEADGPFDLLFDDTVFTVNANIKGSVIVDAVNHTVTNKGLSVPFTTDSFFPEWEPGVHETGCLRPFSFSWEERWL